MKKYNITQKGGVMVEALAMLGLIAMVTPVLYRKAADRANELQDINIASQIRMISQATDAYIKDNYGGNIPTGKLRAADLKEIEKYLPAGYDLNNPSKLLEKFEIAIKSEDVNNRKVYTSAVVAALSNDMLKTRAAKIANMIGANGGLVNNNAGEYSFDGTQGAWTINSSGVTTDFGLDLEGDKVRNNSLVAISNEAISSVYGTVDPSEVLYRISIPGKPERNTMNTDLNMGGHDINNIKNITASGTLYVGKSATLNSGLTVNNAMTNLNKGLTVSGDTTLKNKLTVSGDTTLAKKLTVSGATTLNSGLTVNNAMTTLNKGLTVNNGLTTLSSGLNVTGITKLNGAVFISGNTTMSGNLDMLNHDIDNINQLSAQKLHAHNELTVGGQNHSGESNYMLYVGSNSGAPSNATMSIYGSGTNRAVKINASNNSLTMDKNKFEATAGSDNSLTLANDTTGLTVEHAGSGRLEVGSRNGLYYTKENTGALAMTHSGFYVGTHKGTNGIVTDDNSNYLKFSGVASSGNNGQLFVQVHNPSSTNSGNSLTFNKDGLQLKTDDNTANMYYASGNLIIGGENIVAVGNNYSGYTGQKGISSVGNYSGTTVVISREGVIKLISPSGIGLVSDGDFANYYNDGSLQGYQHGYIRARRLVSNIAYPGSKKAVTATGTTLTGAGSGFDYYQVNPAYTSVMNDIKLASRGGARLSDILPDYINKGIYVAENTIKNLGFDWTVSGITASDLHDTEYVSTNQCGDANCATSPWLGFVPVPLCPPNYNKVITVEPFRWKMSEVYNVDSGPIDNKTTNNYNPWKEDITTVSGYGDGDRTKLFNSSFVNLGKVNSNNITPSGMSISDFYDITTNTSGETELTQAPLLFQTNTWLNTTIYEHDNGSTPRGWSVIMGFIYPGSLYKQFYDSLSTGHNISNDEFIWNLFPVFNKEMASIVRVYCSFQPTQKGQNDTPLFSGYPVHQYNTLEDWENNHTTFFDRAEYAKPYWGTKSGNSVASGIRTINDPSLQYRDAW